jgi:hypothetical protein
MYHFCLTLLAVLTLAIVGWSQEGSQELGRKPTGRPGELSPQEEDRLDEIVERFIQYDIGRNRDPQALADFKQLGPEAIPALIRGLNKSARMSHSCPATVIGKKLNQLLMATTDEEVLDFARENIGAGVGRTVYAGMLNNLKFNVTQRKRQLYLQRTMVRPGQPGSPGYRSPGEDRPK